MGSWLGWPDGSENVKFRFVRLEYDGSGWNDGMDPVSRADINFLAEFRKQTGFKTTEASESHSIALLSKYPRGRAPPFVYMTGDGEIRVPPADISVLRDYLASGGMLLADCGSERWDRSFREFMRQLLPEKRLLVIAEDDPIFQLPYVFPNGAPPLWHFGGMRAMGVKDQGRWVVFYHPGGLKSAWKTDHSGIAEDLVKGSYEVGINVVYYSFTHYLGITRPDRVARVTPYAASIEPDPGAFIFTNRTATRSFAKGVLAFTTRGEPRVELEGYPPWAFCEIESVRAFASAPIKHKTVRLIRDRVAYGQDLLAVMETLGALPFEAYKVNVVGGSKSTIYALLLEVGRQQYAVLVFECDSDRSPCPLRDTFIVTVREHVADILFDVTPRPGDSSLAHISRLLSRYGARFVFTSQEELSKRITHARTPVVSPVTQRITAVAPPWEIPAQPLTDTTGLTKQLERVEAEKLRSR
mgnify:CR=1 FL=1